MKILRRFGIGVTLLFISFLLAITFYGLGEDMMGFIPLWLIKFLIGGITLILAVLLLSIFVLGGYSEMGGFPPTDLEPVVIILSGQGKPKVNVGV